MMCHSRYRTIKKINLIEEQIEYQSFKQKKRISNIPNQVKILWQNITIFFLTCLYFV